MSLQRTGKSAAPRGAVASDRFDVSTDELLELLREHEKTVPFARAKRMNPMASRAVNLHCSVVRSFCDADLPTILSLPLQFKRRVLAQAYDFVSDSSSSEEDDFSLFGETKSLHICQMTAGERGCSEEKK